MEYRTFLQNQYLDALAATFRTEEHVHELLVIAGLGRNRFPPWDDAHPWQGWAAACELIGHGASEIPNAFEALLAAAAARRPSHPVFRQFRVEEAPQEQAQQAVPDGPAAPPVRLLARGRTSADSILVALRSTAAELGMTTVRADLGAASDNGTLLNLAGITMTDAARLARELQARLQTADRTFRAGVATADYRDYMISPVFVEGPDHARFVVEAVPSRTPVRDVANGVVREAYDPKVFGVDTHGRPRPCVVDQVQENGAEQRLDGDRTLEEQGIEHGATLTLNPESRAGAIPPEIREAALARVREEILAFAAAHPDFEVYTSGEHRPTEYTLVFRVPSFGPPARPGGVPEPIEEHEVFLALPGEFPMRAPQAVWQTPIFHPNIHSPTGTVCLGALAENYRPDLDFGDLCQMLLAMAGFRNYAANDGLNADAQHWAVSVEGQMAIEAIGGRSVTREMLEQFLRGVQPAGPVSFRIRRLEG